jgi:hypothetical protein
MAALAEAAATVETAVETATLDAGEAAAHATVEASPAKSTAVEASSAKATAAEAAGMAAAAAKAAATSTVATTATATAAATRQRHGRRRQANCRDRCQRENRFTQHHHLHQSHRTQPLVELEIAGVDCDHTHAHLYSTPREKI